MKPLTLLISLFVSISTNLFCMYSTIESEEIKLKIELPEIDLNPIEIDTLSKDEKGGFIKKVLPSLGSDIHNSREEGFIAPVALVQYPPHYPKEAIYMGIEGFVEVEFIINRRGRIESVKILECSNELFKDPTINAMIKWRFKPARLNDNNIACKAKLRIPFSLIPSSK